MTQHADPARDLSEIRSIMERSSKFLSLSGLAGVSAGLCALAGAGLVLLESTRMPAPSGQEPSPAMFYLAAAAGVLLSALGLAVFFTTRMARKKGLPVWNSTARQVAASMAVPLAAGGAFCGLLWYHGIVFFIPASMLIFYGLALVATARYTTNEVRLLGIAEVLLGLAATLFLDSWLLLWAAGFGLLHIVYGIVMYLRHES